MKLSILAWLRIGAALVLAFAFPLLWGNALPSWLTALLVLTIAAVWNVIDVHRLEKRSSQLTNSSDCLSQLDSRNRIDQELKMLSKVQREIDSKYEDELLLKQAEISALQSQINPHFLYNTLDSIQGQALKDNNVETAQMIAALAAFFRYSINMKGSIVTLSDELQNVQNYVFIQQYRFGDRIKLRVEYDDQEILNCRVPQMVLQPLVENAIYHGLEKTSAEGYVLVRLIRTQRHLEICVEDNGVGMNEQELKQLNDKIEQRGLLSYSSTPHKGGIALRNVHQRIRLLYGEAYGIHIFSAENVGTKSVLTIPIQEGKT